ncbi:hypothetical protein AAY473_011623, partial [Plecturocebus cupreus]
MDGLYGPRLGMASVMDEVGEWNRELGFAHRSRQLEPLDFSGKKPNESFELQFRIPGAEQQGWRGETQSSAGCLGVICLVWMRGDERARARKGQAGNCVRVYGECRGRPELDCRWSQSGGQREGLALPLTLECSGVIVARCSLELLSLNYSPASASWVAGTT